MQFYPMKYLSYLLISIISLLPGHAFAIEEIDSIAVIVNENIISKNEIELRLQDIKQQMQQQSKPLPPEKLLKKQVIERMIMDNIQLQLAKSQGIHVDDLSLNKALEGIAKNNRTTLGNMRRVLQGRGVAATAHYLQPGKSISTGN